MERHRGWVLDIRICWTVLIAFCFLSMAPNTGNAALIGSRLADGADVSSRTTQIEQIRRVLEKDVVSQKLADYGFSAKEISAKLPTLSDAQLHQLAGMSQDLAAGDGVGIVIGVLVIVFLVVLILILVGKRIIIR